MTFFQDESQRILEAICCVCHSVVAYEEQRGWRKGYAIIRLREALDEMNEGGRRNSVRRERAHREC